MRLGVAALLLCSTAALLAAGAAARQADLQLGPAVLTPSPWPQQPGHAWDVRDGSVTWTAPPTRPNATKRPTATFTWTLPASVPAAGARGRLTITASAGDQDTFAPGFSVRGSLVRCTGITNTPSYGTGCADGSHAAVGVALQPNESRRVTQDFLIRGAAGRVTVVTTAPHNVTYTYSATTGGGGGTGGSAESPAIGAGAPDPLPPLPPRPVEAIIVKIDGNGSVTSAPVRALSAAGGAPKRINCREGVYDCYTEVKPGQTLTLTATPQAGYAFSGWTGSCSGSNSTCRVVATDARTVTAKFAAKGAAASVGAALREPRLQVRWVRSIGAGNLVVQGSTTVAARARIDVRRPGGGPLATLQLPLLGGGFRQTLGLRQGSLAGGAKVFPGGFVVALTGRAGRFKLPLQVQTISVPAPPEGVVRQAFRSARQEGRNVPRFPAGAREVWANFRFETQPALNRRLTVRWYRPNGSVVGDVRKSNRPVVSSYMRTASGIGSGVWRAELRTGAKVVSTLSVRIG